MSFEIWKREAREHWEEFQPRRYKALLAAGKLDKALQDAANRTHRELSELPDGGMDPQGAWEMVRERYLFPPEEKE